MKFDFLGNYKNYYEFVNKRVIFKNKKIRIVKNFVNLGVWIVKDSQSRITLNIFKLRIQF